MTRVFWICSIYPSSRDPFLGDFIERQAIAASIFHDITVIHVYTGDKKEHLSKIYNSNLRAEIWSFPMNKLRWRWLQQLIIFINYQKALRKLQRVYSSPDLLHINYVRPGGVAAFWYSIIYSIPYVITEHWSGYISGSKNWIDKICYNRAKKVSAVSKYLASVLNSIFQLNGVSIIPNVIDTEIFYHPKYVRDSSNRDTSNFIFIHNSGEESIKRSMEVVKAFVALFNKTNRPYPANSYEKIQNLELHLYGPIRHDIDVFIKASNLTMNIFQKGMVDQNILSEKLANANCLVQYSIIETFGCIVAESLCCGVPVIVSDIPAMRELVTENVNGKLVNPQDFDSLLIAMEEMVSQRNLFNPSLISEATSNLFSYDQVSLKIKEFYQSAL